MCPVEKGGPHGCQATLVTNADAPTRRGVVRFNAEPILRPRRFLAAKERLAWHNDSIFRGRNVSWR